MRSASVKDSAPATPAILASWTNPGIASGDLADGDRATEAAGPGKPILAHGGASFARSLVRRGLIDEYCLLIHPVALGRGLPLFPDLAQAARSQARAYDFIRRRRGRAHLSAGLIPVPVLQ